jgi:hypothetical protein
LACLACYIRSVASTLCRSSFSPCTMHVCTCALCQCTSQILFVR